MKVLLAVTGCIGAYKATSVLRELQKAGVDVRVVMTRSATKFIQPLTFEALSGHEVIIDMFDRPDYSRIEHITVVRDADILVVAPATANIIGKFANGIADDFLSTLYLSNTRPVLLAPAMNVEMWNHPAVQANIETLRRIGVLFAEPGSGYQACGEVGKGRLAEPEDIVRQIFEIVSKSKARNDLEGECVLITAGPTIEDIDPVRFITNRSSGKMGYSTAEAARDRGAKVILVSGPVDLSPPSGVELISVRSAHEMFEAVSVRIAEASIFIGCAAVADFRASSVQSNKIKKNGSGKLTLELEATEDIITSVASRKDRKNKIIVGFAAESNNLIEYAQKKINAKKLDMIVANDISRKDAGFDTDGNTATILKRSGAMVEIPLMSKREMADRVLDEVLMLKEK